MTEEIASIIRSVLAEHGRDCLDDVVVLAPRESEVVDTIARLLSTTIVYMPTVEKITLGVTDHMLIEKRWKAIRALEDATPKE